VKNQNYSNIEYIVIDGGSSDNTLDILKKYNQILNWISEPDNGQTHAINKGLIRCKGEFVAYLNSDDLYLPDTIETVVNYFLNHPDINMVYGDIIHIDKRSQFINSYKTGAIDFENYLCFPTYLPQPTVFFKRRVLKKIGYFDEKLHLAMDMDYWLRVFLVFNVAYIPQFLAKARIYSETKSQSENFKYLDERLYILDKIFKNSETFESHADIQKQFDDVKRKAYASVHFFGGLVFLRYRKFREAYHHIKIGLKLNPYLVKPRYFYWNVFVAIIGINNSQKIKQFFKIA
jgi:glycosyltransferase involved in cell wall biosynthesis